MITIKPRLETNTRTLIYYLNCTSTYSNQLQSNSLITSGATFVSFSLKFARSSNPIQSQFHQVIHFNSPPNLTNPLRSLENRIFQLYFLRPLDWIGILSKWKEVGNSSTLVHWPAYGTLLIWQGSTVLRRSIRM